MRSSVFSCRATQSSSSSVLYSSSFALFFPLPSFPRFALFFGEIDSSNFSSDHP